MENSVLEKGEGGPLKIKFQGIISSHCPHLAFWVICAVCRDLGFLLPLGKHCGEHSISGARLLSSLGHQETSRSLHDAIRLQKPEPCLGHQGVDWAPLLCTVLDQSLSRWQGPSPYVSAVGKQWLQLQILRALGMLPSILVSILEYVCPQDQPLSWMGSHRPAACQGGSLVGKGGCGWNLLG